MTISDFIMILAVLAAPVLAVQVQKVIESFQRHQQRRQEIFEVLMGTRAEGMRTSYEHVRALNMIDIDFSEKRFFRGWRVLPEQRKVIHAWRQYKDHLNTPPDQPPNDAWGRRADELFFGLLQKCRNPWATHLIKSCSRRTCIDRKRIGITILRSNWHRVGSLKSWKESVPFRSVSWSHRAHPRRRILKGLFVRHRSARPRTIVCLNGSHRDQRCLLFQG